MVPFDFGDPPVHVGIRRFTADEYERMIQAGVLSENDRCELLDGVIVSMAALGSRHIACVNRLVSLLVPLVEGAAIVSPQNAIRLDDESEPEPDIALLRMRPDYYASRLPRADDVLLVIEVSDTTLQYDQTLKVPAYARNAIGEVWVVNLQDEWIDVYSDPIAEGYRSVERVQRGDSITLSPWPEAELNVDDILGKVRS